MTTSGLSDQYYVRAARDGSLKAFEVLVRRHERRIYSLTRRLTGSDHDAQDATQQTFISAMEHLAGFRENAAFSTWLTTIAAHAALKIVRKRRGLPTTSLDAATDPGDRAGRIPHPEYIADWRDTPDRLLQRAETHAILDAAVSDLDPAHRAVFLLRDVESFSVKETARALGISEANVKVRLVRARLRLRERLTRAFGDRARRYAPQTHMPPPLSPAKGATT
jgi:RNA polymerase sigma-70 factor (ECF subfamily)